ncbi:MAG: hypothetical protein OEX81_01165 [Candidatus Pacebacteria bacterium]|nr:hypothetical protein [Candidatus Paceibacterota bacterium]
MSESTKPTGKGIHGQAHKRLFDYTYNKWFGWIHDDDKELFPWESGIGEGDCIGNFIWRNKTWEHANCRR